MTRPFRIWLFLWLCCTSTWAQPSYELSYLLVRSRDGQVLEQQEENKLRTPASTLKLVTAAAALEQLGPEHRYRTTVQSSGRLSRGRLQGDLYLHGEADPELTVSTLDELSRQLHAQGLRRIQGDLVIDEGDFSDPPYGEGWAWDDTGEGYSPEISGLAIDGGVLQLAPNFRADWLVHEPHNKLPSVRLIPGRQGVLVRGELPPSLAPPYSALRTGELFQAALKRHGIEVKGKIRLGVATGETLATHDSRSLREILRQALAVSDNLAMELIYRSASSSLPKVLEGQTLRRADGSGLSRYNLISTTQLVKVLESSPELKSLLPCGGEGTLKQRFLTGEPSRGHIRAKTGSLGNVSGLAGYLYPDMEHEMRFAILINGHVGSGAERKALENELIGGWSRRYSQP